MLVQKAGAYMCSMALLHDMRPLQVFVSWAAVAAFAGVALPALVAATGWAGLVKFWLMPWLGEPFFRFSAPVVHLSGGSQMQRI